LIGGRCDDITGAGRADAFLHGSRIMQVLVVGAGVVGLATARAAALAGHEVIVAEAADAIGTGTSSRNSEVIHAGLYYPTGSIRAALCPRGGRALYSYCASHGVDHRKTGKLVVATRDAETPKLDAILAQSIANGVEGVRMMTRAEAAALEPALACVAAMISPETGIVDSHGLMLALQGEIEDHGGAIAFNTPVERLARTTGGWDVHYGGAEPGSLTVDAVINSAGHGAQRLAGAIDGYPAERVPRHILCKGNYFGYPGRPAFSRLIYPVPPADAGLGVHVTLDLAGRMRFGPDTEWMTGDILDYGVDPHRADVFYAAIRTYWPTLPDASLVPDYCGIRPRITGRGEPQADFFIDAPADHGLPRLVNLFGIESPGLTACLVLGEHILAKLDV
jgi:L-2-hydroxyglutarate oxidase LhgO